MPLSLHPINTTFPYAFVAHLMRCLLSGALHALFEWRRKIVDGSLNPDFLEPSPIPLCSRQYERLYNVSGRSSTYSLPFTHIFALFEAALVVSLF